MCRRKPCRSIAPGPAAVGPWRQVRLERRRRVVVDELALNADVIGKDGRLTVRSHLHCLEATSPSSVEIELSGPSGVVRGPLSLAVNGDGVDINGELHLPDVPGNGLQWDESAVAHYQADL